MRVSIAALPLLLLLCLGAPVAQAQPGGANGPPGSPPGMAIPDEATVVVDCDAGDSLAEALTTPARRLTVEFTGTCAEDVLITRDDLTLRSDGTGVVTGSDDPGDPQAAITLRGAHRILFESFSVVGSDLMGIRASRSSHLDGIDVHVADSANYGILVEEQSGANLRDSSFNGNGRRGIGVWQGSRVALAGAITLNDNVGQGLIASDNSVIQNWTLRPGSVAEHPLALEASNNTSCGLWIQLSSSLFLHAAFSAAPIELRDNPFCGIGVSAGSFSAGPVAISGGSLGVLADGGGTDTTIFGATSDISGNTTGIFVGSGATLSLFDTRVHHNGFFGVQLFGSSHGFLQRVTVDENDSPDPGGFSAGLWVEGSGLDLRDSTVVDNGEAEGTGDADVFVWFDSRGDFQFGTGNTIGNIHCDGTETLRGASCGPQAAAAASALRMGGLTGPHRRGAHAAQHRVARPGGELTVLEK